MIRKTEEKMKIVHGITRWHEHYPNPVVAIGVFDGLHQGHRLLIEKTKERASLINGTPLVMTFHPHPAKVLHPRRKLPMIASLDHRLKLLEDQGIEASLVIHFTKRFALISPDHFVRHYLVKKLNVREIVVGEDFHFGHLRRGNAEFLKKCASRYGFTVHAIPVSKDADSNKVSSSKIRQLLNEGDIEQAAKLLQRPVSVLGKVVRGDRRGRELGYPTANLDPDHTGFAPSGVYCVRVHLKDKTFNGVANVGLRPSFKKNQVRNIEVHLFDFKQNIYGKEILVEFLKKIRDEKKFPSRDALVAQLKSDEKQARQCFVNHL